MPKYKPPQTLASLSSQVFANLALNQIRLLEINPQYKNDNFNEAQEYFNSLPSMIVHQILGKSVELYVNDCKRYSNGDLVSMIQYGQVCENSFSIQEKCVLPNLVIPRLSSIYAFQVSPNVTHLDFTYLIHLGTLSTGTFGNFHRILAECLSRLPALQYLNLKSPNSRTCLPSLTGEHLKILGKSCIKLNYLDISFNTGLKPEELLNLTPDIDPAGRKGCPDLETLHIFDCGFSDKCIKVIAVKLKNLKELGYKEMGSVIKKIYKENFGLNLSTELKITHINHLGGKIRKTSVSSLRCKKNIIDAINSVCSKVTNLKARVQDADMENLVVLKHLNSVELLFNVGRPTSPALGAATFFQVLGPNLTSVALICSAISMVHIQMLGKNCPNLASLWLRSNYFQVAKGSRDELPEDMTANHLGFRNLRTLYFRVGEGELALTFVPTYVLSYILRNAVDLTELKIALRSYIVSDDYICGLLIDCCLYKLEKLLIVVPGINNLSGVIKLTMRTVEFVMDFCTGITSIGNVYSWDVLTHPESEFVKLKKKISDEHLELNLINRHMVLDGIEKNIEEHRTLALRLTQDHESYTNALQTVETSLIEGENQALSDVDKEEIQAVLCRLHTRLNSVSVRLVTQRNESQTKAVEQVNQKLDDLVAMIEFGSDDASKIAESYLNACSNGIGSKFEALLLSCTSDDQKAAKERIKTIIDNMNAIKDDDDNDKKEQSTENSNM